MACFARRRARRTCALQHSAEIQNARVVFPGQGAMPGCMRTLMQGCRSRTACRCHRPCWAYVGEQMMFGSEEGNTRRSSRWVRRFRSAICQPAPPPTGCRPQGAAWAGTVTQVRPQLWEAFPTAHSISCTATLSPMIGANRSSQYGQRFTCAIAADNIFAVQFHPEKSAAHGLRLYRNFTEWQP